MTTEDETDLPVPMATGRLEGRASGTSIAKADATAKTIEAYEKAVNTRRTKFAYGMFVGAVVCMVTLVVFVILAGLNMVAPTVTSTIAVALAGLAAFLVGCARRDLVPYQILYRSKDHTPNPSLFAETMGGFQQRLKAKD